MTCAVFDFATIAKHARLKALDGTPQNVVAVTEELVDRIGALVEGVSVDLDEPLVGAVEFNHYGMYSGGNVSSIADTAPAEWSAPDFDPA